MRSQGLTIVAAVLSGIAATSTPGDDGLSADVAKVGATAPKIRAMNPDGNSVLPAHLEGKVILLAFWTFDRDAKSGMPLDTLQPLRRAFAQDDRFLILTVCVNESEDWEAWGEFQVGQGRVEYEGFRGRFISDPKWWNTVQADPEGPVTSQRYGVSGLPSYFVIDRDNRIAAACIPPEELHATVGRALGRIP